MTEQEQIKNELDLLPTENNDPAPKRFEMLGHFAGGIAHDFNNILSIIEGYTELAVKRLRNNELTEDHLLKILTTTQRGADITRQLLAFGRHNISLNEVFDLGEMIREQEHILKVILGEQITLDIQQDNSELFVDACEENIVQILMNLAVNARDAMNHNGKFSIKLESSENNKKWICLRVQDNGCGMSFETQQKIFQPFFTTKESGQGTGLGLSFIYGIVEQMGGHISVRSKQGLGTYFEIILPRTDELPKEKQTIHKQSNNSVESEVLQGKTILVAEDEPDLRYVLENMFEEMGMNVLCAGNGNEALLVQEDYLDHIDFLLTDVVMPEMDGAHLAELFQSLRPDTNVVFMSGYPSFGYDDRIHLPEDALLIAKPLREEKLSLILQQSLAGLKKHIH